MDKGQDTQRRIHDSIMAEINSMDDKITEHDKCLNMLEGEILRTSWYDNRDEDVVWDLIQKLRKYGQGGSDG